MKEKLFTIEYQKRNGAQRKETVSDRIVAHRRAQYLSKLYKEVTVTTDEWRDTYHNGYVVITEALIG